MRNWIDNGYLKAKNIDLPRKVAFKPRKKYKNKNKKPANVLINRTYRDFKEYADKNPHLLVSQLDTVQGQQGDKKFLLTIHFPLIHFQFGILLESKNPLELNDKLLKLQEKIGIEKWKKVFPIMVTDNGIEFNYLHNLEIDSNGECVSRVFYCNPYTSSQKGACKKNHEFIRYIEPKYHSFNHLDQEKVNKIFSHINSVYRKAINDVRPIDLAILFLGQDFLDAIGIKKIEPDDVNLTQSLTKKIKHR